MDDAEAMATYWAESLAAALKAGAGSPSSVVLELVSATQELVRRIDHAGAVTDGAGPVSPAAGPDAVVVRCRVEDAAAVDDGALTLSGAVHAGRCELAGRHEGVNRVVEALRVAVGAEPRSFTPFLTRTAALSEGELTTIRDEVGLETILLEQVTAQSEAYEIADVISENGPGYGRWRAGEASYDIHVAAEGCRVLPSSGAEPQVTVIVEDPLSWMRWLGSELEFADLYIQDAVAIEGEFAIIEGIARALPHLR